ncbi:MAG: hypothetical protein WC465_05120 [Patescibacteria group bacterium]
MPDYQPLTPKELERGYYFLAHRALFIRLFWILGILSLVIIYGILVFNLVKYFRGPTWSELAQNITSNSNWASYHAARAPENIIVGPVRVLPVGDDLYNFVAIVENPNEKWILPQFDYRFIIQGQPLPVEQAFLNAQEDALLLKIGYKSDLALSNLDVQLETGNYQWYRLDSSITPIEWDVRDISWQPASNISVDEKSIPLPATATWQAQNLSLFDFWQVDWQVALFSGDTIVGVAAVTDRDFSAQQTKHLEAVWHNSLPHVSRVEIWPRLNWADKSLFKDSATQPRGSDRLRL